MKFEVLTGEDAQKAEDAGNSMQYWNSTTMKWVDVVGWVLGRDDIYRIKPNPPEKNRVPLPDLRVLAGAMLVWPDGSYTSICEIQPDGQALGTKDIIECVPFTAEQLAKGYHYDRGAGPVPCWTEVEV